MSLSDPDRIRGEGLKDRDERNTPIRRDTLYFTQKFKSNTFFCMTYKKKCLLEKMFGEYVVGKVHLRDGGRAEADEEFCQACHGVVRQPQTTKNNCFYNTKRRLDSNLFNKCTGSCKEEA